MTHPYRSSINSSLFMNDPVPVRRHDRISNNLNDQTFFIKGDDTKNDPIGVYENKDDDQDTYIVKPPNGDSFQLNRRVLKDSLEDLKKLSHIPIRQLNDAHTESFRTIVEALKLLHTSPALYELILSDIRAIFNDIKDVRPGTLAAFFIGCFNPDDKFPAPMGCSPKCAASLPPSEGTPGYSSCDDIVLIYSKELFSSLNNKQSSHAFIYIENSSFSGFTHENIKQLKDAGIESATLIYGNEENGSYHEVTSPLPLDQLPHKSEITQTIKTTQIQQNDNSASSNSGAGVIFAIIIIIIIILLIVILYKTYSPRL